MLDKYWPDCWRPLAILFAKPLQLLLPPDAGGFQTGNPSELLPMLDSALLYGYPYCTLYNHAFPLRTGLYAAAPLLLLFVVWKLFWLLPPLLPLLVPLLVLPWLPMLVVVPPLLLVLLMGVLFGVLCWQSCAYASGSFLIAQLQKPKVLGGCVPLPVLPPLPPTPVPPYPLIHPHHRLHHQVRLVLVVSMRTCSVDWAYKCALARHISPTPLPLWALAVAQLALLLQVSPVSYMYYPYSSHEE